AAEVAAGKKAVVPYVSLSVFDSAALQLRCAETFASVVAPTSAAGPPAGKRRPHDRIRVAYLSAGLPRHATAYLMAGLFEAHDCTRFEVTALSFGPETGDEMQTRVRAAVAHFVDVRDRTDAEAARILRDGEIDIAVDLKGYSLFSRPG